MIHIANIGNPSSSRNSIRISRSANRPTISVRGHGLRSFGFPTLSDAFGGLALGTSRDLDRRPFAMLKPSGSLLTSGYWKTTRN